MFEWIRHWRYGNQYEYEKFFRGQDPRPQGKPGIILSELGMPEVYKPEFYINLMDQIFLYSLPVFLQPYVLADSGIALIDPLNPLAREPFVPLMYARKQGPKLLDGTTDTSSLRKK